MVFKDCPSGSDSTTWPTYKFAIQQISSGVAGGLGGIGTAASATAAI